MSSIAGGLALTLAGAFAAGAQSPAAIAGAPTGVTAFVHVAVIPMERDTVFTDQTVLVQAGRIIALGQAGRVRVPAGAMQIDGRGKFLLPGLADMHAHFFAGTHLATQGSEGHIGASNGDSTLAETKLFMWLANGVTTVRNLDYVQPLFAREALALRARAAAGASWLPHIYTAGPWGPYELLNILPFQPGKTLLGGIADDVTQYKAAGYDVLKVHEERPEVLDSVLAAAKRVGMPIAGHVPQPTTVEHILAVGGYKSIEHPVNDYLWGGHTQWDPRDTAGFGAVAAAMRKAGVWNCPTQQHYDRLHYEPLWGTSPRVLKVLQDSGVKLLLGTDEFPWQGVISQELRAMVAAGLTPYQALLTGTRNVAEYWGTLAERGTIAVGKQADLVLLTGNPLEDVRYTAQPAGVMIGGRWLSRAEIDKHLATLTMPTFTNGELVVRGPIKRYWQNMADEALEGGKLVLSGVTLSKTQRTQYQNLRATHEAQWQALVDSLGEGNEYAAGTQRLFKLLAQQFGDDRAFLTLEQRATFDPKAHAWLRLHRIDDGSLAIPGVQP